ncbi:carboxypeptidase-like regulatory domain-containing protein [Paludibaculum fermentans]|uniref:TonB-dependent receptor n=1 Tax=Paludibaculum fermentans TaxID=1473598 RepID=A0A7S7NKR4_PALFE|nr:TonB-dependent receptor [Paludibaculum fermentans]QOY85442.1 TonB-dependent receptor [Paludibaculum fermentans]
MKRVVTIALSAWLALLLQAAAWSQTGNGSVRGVVRDQSSSVIPGAEVTLTNAETNIELRARTNEAGLYVFPSVPPGPQLLRVSFAGMGAFEARLTVRVQESSNVEVLLQPASTSTTVQVTDVTPIVVADNATLGHSLESKRIEELPINGRQLTNLLLTTPGMTFDSNGRIRTMGEGPATHDIVLDGSPLTDMVYGEGTLNRQPSLESIQEFRVDTNANSARSPRPTNIIMTTKSGTNQFHGSLFETNRDNYYGLARRREDGNTASKFIRNEYGFTAGGPVFVPKVYNGKSRTFWFFALEEFRQSTGTTGAWRVPTDAMREGDFSGLTDANLVPQRIYNPYTTNSTTFQRQQFSYQGKANAIDPSLASPLWKYLMSEVPHANRPDVNPAVGNNYFGPSPSFTNQSTWSLRIDQKVTDKDQLFARLTSATHHNKWNSGGVPSTDGIVGYRAYDSPNKTLSVNWTRSVTPTLVNELLVSGTRTISSSGMGNGDNSRLWATELGLPNPALQSGFPVIGSLGINGSGNFWNTPLVRGEFFSYFVLDDNATKMVGRHELQFGFHGRRDLLNYLPQQQRSGGALTFPGVTTALYDPNYPDRSVATVNTGSAMAAAFLGTANYEYRVVKGKYYMRRNEFAGYLQDNFKVSQRLTLNLGLRWDFNPIPTEKNNVFTSYDRKTGAIVLGRDMNTLYNLGAVSRQYIAATQGVGVTYETPDQAGLPYHMVNNNWRDVSPHLGLAYRALEGKRSFVVRAGYSVNYYPIPMYGWNDSFKMNTPFYAVYINQTLTSRAMSPDGLPNYGLVSSPSIIAGKNSSNAISFDNLSPGALGLGSNFQAAYFDPNQPSSRAHTWNFTLEKEVLANTVVRLSYNGNHGAHLESYQDLNQSLLSYGTYNWYKRTGNPVPEGDTASMLTNAIPTSPLGTTQLWGKDGWSNSHGITAEVERRYAKGIGFQAFYQLTNANRAAGEGWYVGTDLPEAYPTGQLPSDLHQRMRLLNYGRDTQIPQHEIRFNWSVEVPVGRGKALGHNMPKAFDAIAGGWQVAGMGRFYSNYLSLPTDMWPTGQKVEYYGHKYPIQDCRSGTCEAGYLLWNGYIPAYLINQPNGIMGVPANYKAAAAPTSAFPANFLSLQGDDPSAPNYDPNYSFYGTSDLTMKLSDGSVARTTKADLNPFRNTYLPSTWLSTTDASIFKLFRFGERANLKVKCDFFNVFNQPGMAFNPGDGTGIVTKQYSQNSPRQLQLSARFSW